MYREIEPDAKCEAAPQLPAAVIRTFKMARRHQQTLARRLKAGFAQATTTMGCGRSSQPVCQQSKSELGNP